jgi:hypothetical protein
MLGTAFVWGALTFLCFLAFFSGFAGTVWVTLVEDSPGCTTTAPEGVTSADAGAAVSAGALVSVVGGCVSAGGAGVGATVFVVVVVSGVAGAGATISAGVLVSRVAAEVTVG